MDPAARRGRFFVFEGIEGAGKSTQVHAVAAGLRTRGHDCVVTREPGGTVLGQALRELLLTHREPDRSPVVEALLMMADRADHLERVVKPALAAGRHVISDRYEDATFAYQGGGSGVSEDLLHALSRVATGGLRPDLVVWLDLPVETAQQRLSARGGHRDRFESEERAFFERVRDAYQRRAAAETERWWRLDARRDPAALSRDITERFAALCAAAESAR